MSADRLALAALLLCLAGPMPAGAEGDSAEPAGSAATVTEHRFAVYYGDRRIGEHRYDVQHLGTSTRVHSRADFQVKVLFVNAYRYRHRARELWQDGCLTQLAAVTDDNGERFRFETQRRDGGLVLTRQAPESATRPLHGDCPATFAYWDRERLMRDALINAQTGAALASTLTRLGTETVDGERAVRYRLEAETLQPIDLWYRASDDQWLRLETRRDGAKLSYRLEETSRREAGPVDVDTALRPPDI